jgi:hypothetical protein
MRARLSAQFKLHDKGAELETVVSENGTELISAAVLCRATRMVAWH